MHELRVHPNTPGANNGWLRWRGCAVMGVLNLTPDSFSDGGRHATVQAAVSRALELWAAGAAWIDLGGESTRPGAEPVAAETELDRVLPVLRELAGREMRLSIDTLKPEVADAALRAGAQLVNDVSGLGPAMQAVCAAHGVPGCIGHLQGEPRTMQRDPQYRDPLAEVAAFLRARRDAALARGVPGVLLDPGLGFGKRLEHNLALLRGVSTLATLGPVLVGASRKGMIGTLGGESDPARRDPGSVAAHLYAARRGAAMVRAHDAAGHVQALRVQAALEDA